jgi:hypothetical protein
MSNCFRKRITIMGVVGLWVLPPYLFTVPLRRVLSPNGNGNYTQWSAGPGCYTWVDEVVGCPGDTNLANLLTETWIDAGPPPGD